jgi:O-antigen/teichoic acid export membrane protein
MRRFEKIQFINNVGSSWFALGINVAVGVFLTPFILHRLGDVAYGIWVLIFSITGYYGLFDLGIRSSIVRYASKFTATDSKEELAKLINTSLFTYGGIGILSLLITMVLFLYVDNIFKVPAELHATARWLLLMVGVSVACGFPLGVFGGFLDGLQRFDVNNWTSVASNLLRAGLIVAALDHRRGLLTIALITVVLPLITSLMRGIIAFRIHPVAFGLQYVDRATFRMMASYSGVTLIIMIAGRLKFKTDTIVIGTMLSAAAITYFNIAGRMVDYAGEIVTALAQNFLPMASRSEAKGSMDNLRKVFVTGNRLCAFTILPVTAVLLVLGKSIIEVWVGRKYIATSYPVLVILIIPATLMWAQAASGRVLFGISKHRTWAFVTLAEGISNLVLSILLVRILRPRGVEYGIIGDALGTAIPLTCSMVLFMPRHLCKQLGIRVRTYLREAFVLPVLVSAPLVLVLLLMRRWFVAHNYWQLGIQLLVAGIVYASGLAWAYFTHRALRIGQLAAPQKMNPFDAGLVASAVEDV